MFESRGVYENYLWFGIVVPVTGSDALDGGRARLERVTDFDFIASDSGIDELLVLVSPIYRHEMTRCC